MEANILILNAVLLGIMVLVGILIWRKNSEISDKISAIQATTEDNVKLTRYLQDNIQVNAEKQVEPVKVESAEMLEWRRTKEFTEGKHNHSGLVDYVLPPVFMLSKGMETSGEKIGNVERHKQILQRTLESFNVGGEVTGTIIGPRVTRFEVSLAPGVSVDKIFNIESNIAMELESDSIRILAPIPGRNAVGVEVPNSVPDTVCIRAILETDQWKNSKYRLPIVLGKDIAGRPAIFDLAQMPHLLIAGSAGSGKSVCMNSLIISLLLKFSPDELRIIMIDPKMLDTAIYAQLPHLITPVVNDTDNILPVLNLAVNEMEKRYWMLAKTKTKNITDFNSRSGVQEPPVDNNSDPIPEKLPFLIIMIDELADIMMSEHKNEVEAAIARLAQKGRAVGIHLVVMTSRPSVNIITGELKSNFSARIALKVGSIVDSRVILDQKGAEKLLGQGDMLFMPQGNGNTERIQGAMVADQDIANVVEFIVSQREQFFDDIVLLGDTIKEKDYAHCA